MVNILKIVFIILSNGQIPNQLQAALAIRGFTIRGFYNPRIPFNAQNLVSAEFPLIIRKFFPVLS